MARGNPSRFRRFARGLNTADGPYGLQEGFEDDPSGRGSECRACLNVVSRSRGNVGKRDGCTDIASVAATTPLSLAAIGQDAAGFLIAACGDGSLRTLSAALSFTTVATGLSTTAPWSWVRDDDGYAYGSNGTDTPRKVNAAGSTTWTPTSTVVTSPGSVNCRYLTQAGNRTFSAGDAARPYSLFISEIADPTVLTAEVQFNPGSNYPITGLGTSGPYVLVFTERDIYVVYDTETGANRKLATGAGTLAHRTIVETEKGTFFLDARRGMMVCDGATAPRAIGDQIRPEWDKIAQEDHAAAGGVWFDRHYYLSAPFDGTLSILDYDSELDSWWPQSPATAEMAVWDRGEGAGLVGLVGYEATTEVWDMFVPDVPDDPHSTFQSFWSSPFHVFGNGHLRKRGREIHFDGRGKLRVFLAGDYRPNDGDNDDDFDFDFTSEGGIFGGTGTFGGVGTFGGSVTVGEDSLYSFGVARSWSVTVRSDGADYWEMDAYTMLMTTRTE